MEQSVPADLIEVPELPNLQARKRLSGQQHSHCFGETADESHKGHAGFGRGTGGPQRVIRIEAASTGAPLVADRIPLS